MKKRILLCIALGGIALCATSAQATPSYWFNRTNCAQGYGVHLCQDGLHCSGCLQADGYGVRIYTSFSAYACIGGTCSYFNDPHAVLGSGFATANGAMSWTLKTDYTTRHGSCTCRYTSYGGFPNPLDSAHAGNISYGSSCDQLRGGCEGGPDGQHAAENCTPCTGPQ